MKLWLHGKPMQLLQLRRVKGCELLRSSDHFTGQAAPSALKALATICLAFSPQPAAAFNPTGKATLSSLGSSSSPLSACAHRGCCVQGISLSDGLREAEKTLQLPDAALPSSSGKLHQFMPTEEGCTCRTPDKFQGSREDGASKGTFRVQFTLPGQDGETKTIDLLQSTEQGVPSFGAVAVKLPLGASVKKTGSQLLVDFIKEDSNAECSRLREGDIIRAVSLPETGTGSQEDIPWWARIGRTPVPDAEEGMVILDDRSAAECNAALQENLRVNGKGAEAVLLVERLSPEDGPGKFVKVGDARVPHAFGARAVVVGGYKERDLEMLDGVLDAVGENSIYEMPVIVLAQEDSKTTMSNLLSQRLERDHVLPSKKPMNIEPFVLFSGLPMPRVKEILTGMRAVGLPPSAVALAVPGALEKTMQQLTNEVIDDFNANANPEQ